MGTAGGHDTPALTPHGANRLPSTLTAAVPRPFGWMRLLMPPLLVAGCAPWDRPVPIPGEVTQAGAAARVVVPRDLNVNPSGSVVEPGTPAAEPAPSQGPGPERTIFALPDAIAFALRNSPRLRSARAAIERARGQNVAQTAKAEKALAARIGEEHALVAEVGAQLAEARFNLRASPKVPSRRHL